MSRKQTDTRYKVRFKSMKSFGKRLSIHMLAAVTAAAVMVSPVLAAGIPQLPEDYHSPFSDVGENQWFYPFVCTLNLNDVIAGYDDGRFGPYDNTKAGDAILMVMKATGSGNQFPAQGEHYAAGYVNYAVSQGWLTKEEVPASLDGEISRLFIARLAAKALGLTPITHASPFDDVDDGYVTALYRLGIVVGSEENGQRLFHPDSSINRAELSTIIWQIMSYADRESDEGYIKLGSYTLQALENVPVSTYDPSKFQKIGDRMTYNDSSVTTSLGVDVSYHQGTIDWEKVADDGIDFAMIRAGGRYYGSGVVFEDSQFRKNLQGAMDAGLETGVYFFSQAVTVEEAREEAQFLLDMLKDFDFNGPVVFDWENIDYDTARTDGVGSAMVTAMANAFCQEVESAGYQPMIYFNRYIAYLIYELGGVADYPFWIAEYGETPEFYYDYQIWQYTDSGKVDGISGPVDMNIRLTRK